MSILIKNWAKPISYSRSLSVLLDLTCVSGKHNLSHNLTSFRTVTFPCALLICSFPFTVVYTRVSLCSYMSLFSLIQVRLVTQTKTNSSSVCAKLFKFKIWGT